MAKNEKTKAVILADAIYRIKMLKPRVVYGIKTAVGDLVDVFAKDAERFVGRDKQAEYDPPLKEQQEALAAAK